MIRGGTSMSRAQTKSSPTDEHARRIAQAIAKGRPPPFNDAFDRYCESSPREIFAAFTGAARHMPPVGKDEPLALGYLFLLQRLLEHLRYRTDRGYADASQLIADFQADVVAQVEAGNVNGRMLAFVGGALHQSKIPASPELAAASTNQLVDRNQDGALPQVAASLTPTEVRRLIAMRNWRPENERAEVDAVIRKARAAGIDCAPWEAGSIEAIAATAVDGSTAQGFLLISPAGRKKRMSSLLIKGGIADAWSGEPESRRRVEMTLAAAGMDTPTLTVSRSYLDCIVAHQLALSIEKREAPPFGLLQVAETIGGADWQPARMGN